jgi:hypothetical protein
LSAGFYLPGCLAKKATFEVVVGATVLEDKFED